MPVDFRKLRREIEKQGLFLEETKKGHYKILSPDGTVLTVFAVSHGKRLNEAKYWTVMSSQFAN